MKICSLVPGATEVVAALGMADRLVGISHECDFPATVRHAPVMVEAVVGSNQASHAIDQAVKDVLASGQRLYRLNEQAFIEAQPDVILSQDLCHVCAVTPDQLSRAIRTLPSTPKMVTLNPTTLDDILSDVERIGRSIGAETEGKAFAATLRDRLERVRRRAAERSHRPRVLCLEWLAPLYRGGHWVPEMVDIAGGTDVLGHAGQPSKTVSWEAVAASHPEIVVVMPCGFSVERTIAELCTLVRTSQPWAHALATWTTVAVVDAASYFSRPGPRLIDGAELLADILAGSSTRFDRTAFQFVTAQSLSASLPQ